MGTSQRNSYLTDDQTQNTENPPPLPLNYIVRLHDTFSDADSINFIFEFLPGQDLYWVIQNQMVMQLGKDSKKQWVKFYGSQILCALETV